MLTFCLRLDADWVVEADPLLTMSCACHVHDVCFGTTSLYTRARAHARVCHQFTPTRFGPDDLGSSATEQARELKEHDLLAYNTASPEIRAELWAWVVVRCLDLLDRFGVEMLMVS